MFLTLQHPFTDLRWLVGPETGRLARPAWPLANPRKDFVRASGRVNHRRRGGVAEWSGEHVYSDASRALLFPDHLRDLELGSASYHAKIYHATRRYYSNGEHARLEVGVRFNVWGYPSVKTEVDKFNLLRRILELPVRACGKSADARAVGLVHAGDLLAEHFLFASTARGVATQPWWFSAGSPAIVVDYYKLWDRKQVPLPSNTRHVLDLPEVGISLSHCWLSINQQPCSTWIIEREREHDEVVRKLRVHLTRLHTERECLNTVLCHARDGGALNWASSPQRAEALQYYLNNVIRAIESPQRFGFNQAAMMNVAQRAYEVACSDLSLHELRRQLAEKVKCHLCREEKAHSIIIVNEGGVMVSNEINGPINSGGDVNIIAAQSIQDSFNKIQDSQLSVERQDSIKAVTEQIKALVKKLPADQAKAVSKDFDAFISEVSSPTPRKAWYELSAKSILETAKSVAELVEPVTKAVAAVIALLPG